MYPNRASFVHITFSCVNRFLKYGEEGKIGKMILTNDVFIFQFINISKFAPQK